MNPRRILATIHDPATQKILIMHWWEQGEITPALAERLIRELGLEGA